MNKELEEQFPGTTLGSKKLQQKLRRLRTQYTQFTELVSHTEPPKSPATYALMEEDFLAAATSRGKEPVNLEEGSGDSDDPVHEVTETVVTASRRQVRRRSSNADSRLQECLDMLKKCIYKKLSDEEVDCCPVCNIDLGCLSVEKLRKCVTTSRPDHNLPDIRAKIFPLKRRKINAPELLAPGPTTAEEEGEVALLFGGKRSQGLDADRNNRKKNK
ncbi:hypothetical protein CRG98_019941 [Punica granatum]|uniref:Uncharacterized protein n=1 Tax=Punica granatum TaxID=22663 RepID=A0A2I0JTN3_PUNGR|nr:hypothetical protein CRG98_019941 [Punica granatum]